VCSVFLFLITVCFLIILFSYCAEVGIHIAIKPEFRITPPVSSLIITELHFSLFSGATNLFSDTKICSSEIECLPS